MSYITEKNRDDILKTAEFLHRHPELSSEEVMTTKFIKDKLSEMDIEIIDAPLKTGVVGIIRGAHPGKTIALRADIDALPVLEDASHEIRSETDGVMHACGHDIHTASLLGAACGLKSFEDSLHGNVMFVFQPAEEISLGAKEIIDSKVFDIIKPDAFFSMHVMPNIPNGQIGIRQGSIMAGQTGFKVTVHGKGGHGSAPHTACDPIIAVARIIDALQSLTARENDPFSPCVLSVCTMHGGSAINIIPDDAYFAGTCRFLDNNRSQGIKERIEQIASKTAEVHNCRAEVEFFRELPALNNDKDLASVAEKAATSVFGEENVFSQLPMMASEDFPFFNEIAPVFMYHVGIGGNYPLHNSKIHIPEDSAVKSAELFINTVLTYLQN